jgi:hypothetical protein
VARGSQRDLATLNQTQLGQGVEEVGLHSLSVFGRCKSEILRAVILEMERDVSLAISAEGELLIIVLGIL